MIFPVYKDLLDSFEFLNDTPLYGWTILLFSPSPIDGHLVVPNLSLCLPRENVWLEASPLWQWLWPCPKVTIQLNFPPPDCKLCNSSLHSDLQERGSDGSQASKWAHRTQEARGKAGPSEGPVCGASNLPSTLWFFFWCCLFMAFAHFSRRLVSFPYGLTRVPWISSFVCAVNIFSHFGLCVHALCHKKVSNCNVVRSIDLFLYLYGPLCSAEKGLSQLNIVNLSLPFLSLLFLWFLSHI